MDRETIMEVMKTFLVPAIRCEVETRLQESVYKKFVELEDRLTKLEKAVMYKPILKSKMEEVNAKT